MSHSLIGLMAGAAALAGCATIPQLPDPTKAAAAENFATAKSFQAPDAAWPADRWWAAYGDPQLEGLMDEALAGSPSLAQAAARLRAADARARQARAATLPGVEANAQAAETKQSYNNGIPAQFVPRGYNDTGRASLDLSYDLDLWGRNRAALKAATSEAEAARMDAAEARLALTTAIAGAYADFARLSAEHDAADAALKNREASADLVARRVTGGAANPGEADQARAAAAAARQDLAALDEQLTVVRNQLAALAGAGPDRGLALARPHAQPKAGFGLPSHLAADLLGRRPDLQAARLRAEAAARRIDVARAGFYPNINLAAFIGLQSLGLNNLTSSGSDIGQAGAAISLPIFDGGRLDGAYRGARADYDAAVAAYDQTLVQALQEVADAAAGQRALQARLGAARDSLASGEQAYRVARLRYEGGLTSYLTLLTAEDSVIAQRRAVAQLEARALTLDASLVRALGGGFRA
ncbi:MAG: efflux transporter outer membrane subunit [Phenylobacterium sp.]|uniref:efflux transporter outer membrane subunit n=1 Tax=Phenylobacterium sp. TaxID=1871053 RepID=UPI001216B3BE|nr:efflux transporter outer membrane subunit [Phenylobacterium sp.]TAJ70096.1 MAG: efflux transporter outer membrane subunit [Phenylobacterium sp.]